MNERIQELYMQAVDYSNGQMSFGDTREFFAAKFAELLVRECARVAIQKQTENDIEGIVSENPAKDFAYALIEHFGVENE